jgi:hypothetical protein
MRRGRPHRHAVWLCVALHLFLTLGMASGLVLCVGRDGHAAVESRFAEDCCADEAAGERAERLTRVSCVCTDAPLLQPAAERGGAPAVALPPLASVIPPPAADPVRAVARGLPPPSSGSSGPPLRALRTVVMLL